MADFSMSFTIPDDKIDDLVKAVDWHWPLPKDEQGNPVSRTPAQAKAVFEGIFRQKMRNTFSEYKRWEASQAINIADLNDS